MITPLLEVDGRDKMVDCAMAPRKDPDGSYPTRPLYWGKYVVHDNNRDNLGLSLALSRHLREETPEFRKKFRERLLSLDGEDIRRAAKEILEPAFRNAPVCVLSSREKLEEANKTLRENELKINDL